MHCYLSSLPKESQLFTQTSFNFSLRLAFYGCFGLQIHSSVPIPTYSIPCIYAKQKNVAALDWYIQRAMIDQMAHHLTCNQGYRSQLAGFLETFAISRFQTHESDFLPLNSANIITKSGNDLLFDNFAEKSIRQIVLIYI